MSNFYRPLEVCIYSVTSKRRHNAAQHIVCREAFYMAILGLLFELEVYDDILAVYDYAFDKKVQQHALFFFR